MGASKVLGIIGLCTGWLIPISGVTLGIIGASIKKEKNHEDRDKTLNALSIIVGALSWIIQMAILL